MSRKPLESNEVEQFVRENPGWTAAGAGLDKGYSFSAYRDGIGFAVALAIAAEHRDHHPDIAISWGKVTVRWTTHDAGGVTALDREMALLTDSIAAKHGGGPLPT